MKFSRPSTVTIIFTILWCIACASGGALATDPINKFTLLVEKDVGLSPDEKNEWIFLVSREFQKNTFSFDYSGLVYGILSQAKFDEVGIERAISVALQSAHAVEKGAPEKEISELALFAFSVDFTPEELRLYAAAAAKCNAQGLPVHITQEMIRHAKEGNWPPGTFRTVMEGLIRAQTINGDMEKVALFMLISVDQKLGTPEQIVRDALEDAKERKARIAQEKRPKEAASTRPRSSATPLRVALEFDTFRNSVESFIGTPYRWGGNTRSGVDCSGFTRLVMNENGYTIPRVSRDQAKAGVLIPPDRLRLGDLVFFDTRGSGYVTHVGLYLGGNLMVHASSSKGVTIVLFSNRYFQSRFVTARRVVRYTER